MYGEKCFECWVNHTFEGQIWFQHVVAGVTPTGAPLEVDTSTEPVDTCTYEDDPYSRVSDYGDQGDEE